MPVWLIWLLAALVAIPILLWQVRAGLGRFRRQRLMSRFGHDGFVDTIMEGRIARGMTAEMVIAAWGDPADLDETVMKTKTKHEMKYDQKGKNRFGTRVYLEDGVVVGWESK